MKWLYIIGGKIIKKFITKKLMARIAIEILNAIALSTKNTIDDNIVRTIIAIIEKEYEL